MTPFKIGSIYRDKRGELMRLEVAPRDVFAGRPCARATPINAKDPFDHAGSRFLDTGQYVFGGDDFLGNLIPGELNAQGEPIAPTFYCAAETIKPETCCGGEPEASGVAHRTDAPEVDPLWRPALTWDNGKPFDAFNGYYSVCSATATDRPERILFGPFAGYLVTRDTATPDHAYSHYLTRVADAGAQVAPASGSAWLVVR